MLEFIDIVKASWKSSRKLDKKSLKNIKAVSKEYNSLNELLEEIKAKAGQVSDDELFKLINKRDEKINNILAYLKDIILFEETELIRDVSGPKEIIETFLKNAEKLNKEDLKPLFQPLIHAIQEHYDFIAKHVEEILEEVTADFNKVKRRERFTVDHITLL